MFIKLEFVSNREELKVAVEVVHVDTATGATGVEDNGVRGVKGAQERRRRVGGSKRRSLLNKLAVRNIGSVDPEGARGGRLKWLHVNDEGNEEQRDQDEKQTPFVALHFLGVEEALPL